MALAGQVLAAVFLSIRTDAEFQAGVGDVGAFADGAAVEGLGFGDFRGVETSFSLHGFADQGTAAQCGKRRPNEIVG